MLLADLAPASFRGVRFYVPKDTGEEGRNVISHQYPDSNVRYNEDNGGHAPTFKVTALLFGAGLPGKLNALRNALNKAGPGTLNHPYLGSWNCSAIGPYKYERTDEDAGVITLDLTFSVTGDPIFPGIVQGVAAAVSILAGNAVANIASSFVSSYGAGPLSATSRDTIAAEIQTIGLILDQSFAASSAPVQMTSAATNLASEPAALIALIANSVRSAVDLDIDTLSPERLMAGFKSVFDAGSATAAAGIAVS